MRRFLLPCAATGVSLRAVWCLSGVILGDSRGRPPWHDRRGATGWARGGWRCCRRVARPL